CIAQLSVLGPNSRQSGQKQVKSWKNDYDKYLKISRILIDRIYLDVNEPLCPESVTDETVLEAEIGEEIPVNDYVQIFCNCCTILRYMFDVKLDLAVPVAYEKTFDVIAKVLTITHQQYSTIHNRKQPLINSLPTMFELCIHLFDRLVTCVPACFLLQLKKIAAMFISLLDAIRPDVSITIYRSLENLFNFFDRNLRMDVDILQKLIRWIVHETSIRLPSKIPTDHLTTSNHTISRAALDCIQSLIGAYGDYLPSDQYQLLQNHYVNTLSDYQAHCADQTRKKPYDDVTCRMSLYAIIEMLLQEERHDCPTILAVVKDLIKEGLQDPSGKVRKAVHKLRSSRSIALDSTHHFYQPFIFENVEKPRYVSTTLPSTTTKIHHPPSSLLEHTSARTNGSVIQLCAPTTLSNHDKLSSYPPFSSSAVTYKTSTTSSLLPDNQPSTDLATAITTPSISNDNTHLITTLNNITNDNNNKINSLNNTQRKQAFKNQEDNMRIYSQEYDYNISSNQNIHNRDGNGMINSIKRQKVADMKLLNTMKLEDDEDDAENIFRDAENDVEITVEFDETEKVLDNTENIMNDEEDLEDIDDEEVYEENEEFGDENDEDEESTEEIDDDGIESTEEIDNEMEIKTSKPINGNGEIDRLSHIFGRRWKMDGKQQVIDKDFEDIDDNTDKNEDDNDRIYRKKYPRHNLTNGLLKMNDTMGQVQQQMPDDELEEGMDEDDDIAVISSDSENNQENSHHHQEQLYHTLANGDNNLLYSADTYNIPITTSETVISKDINSGIKSPEAVCLTETIQKTQITETEVETVLITTTTTDVTKTVEIVQPPSENCNNNNKIINSNTSIAEPNSYSVVDTAVKDALVATVLLVEDLYEEK
ncbi:unnamed protein product, partial [Didymodactylos carnosus]